MRETKRRIRDAIASASSYDEARSDDARKCMHGLLASLWSASDLPHRERAVIREAALRAIADQVDWQFWLAFGQPAPRYIVAHWRSWKRFTIELARLSDLAYFDYVDSEHEFHDARDGFTYTANPRYQHYNPAWRTFKDGLHGLLPSEAHYNQDKLRRKRPPTR